MRLWTILTLFAVSAAAQVGTPRLGFVRDKAGALRPLLGVAGNVVLGESIEENVISAGFGRTMGFAKKQDELLRIRSGKVVERIAAPTGEAKFFLAGGEIASIYFPEAKELWKLSKSGFEKDTGIEEPQTERLWDAGWITNFEWLSDAWVVVRSEGTLQALRVVGAPQGIIHSDRSVMQIPEPAQ
jgi:hypothetical protein